MMDSRGFTVVEMVVVCCIIGILIGIAVPSFKTYNSRERIKNQVKMLHSNIASIRLSALQNRKRTILKLGPNQYTFTAYSSIDDSVGTLSGTFTYSLVMQKISGGALANLNAATDCIEFDTSGLTSTTNCASNTMKLVVTPVTYNSSDNCIVVANARTNIGRMENVSSCRIW